MGSSGRASDELVDRARAWVAAVHPHACHLERTLEWLLVLEPAASEALRLAAIMHDIERAFEPVQAGGDPAAGESPPPAGGDALPPADTDPASAVYTAWHQERSARLAAGWLRDHGAPGELVGGVEQLVRVHEEGGTPEADLLQAADSIAFLEVQIPLFTGMVRSGRLSRAAAERKFRWMYERVRVPRARAIVAPLLASALSALDAAVPERSQMMRAYVLDSFDAEPGMRELPVPELTDESMLVRVHSASVNPVDLAIAGGGARAWLEYRFPVTIGRDLAGEVLEVGSAVRSFAPGDRVFGFIAEDHAQHGSFSEYVAIPEGRFVIHQPDGVGHDQAGALGLAAVTATMCLDAAGVGSGSRLLINGATGGVGSYAIQIGKARGAHVVATARPGAEEEHVRGLGADEVIDWSEGDVGGALRRLQAGGVDGLVDLVTGDPGALSELAAAVLTADGKVATTLNAADAERLDGRSGTNVWSYPDTERMRAVAEHVAAGSVRAPVTEMYDFDRLEDAFAAVRRGAVGKVGVRLIDGGEERR